MKNRLWLWLGISLAIGVGWHIVLFLTPTDGLVGTANFQGDQFRLLQWVPGGSPWAEDGISTYRAVLRVDARSIADWLIPSADKQAAWSSGSRHQYLVERRDNEGKRVINTVLKLPDVMSYLNPVMLAALVTLLVVIAIGTRYPDLPALPPLIVLGMASLLGLSWFTFAVPFSYIGLGWPFWWQLTLHAAANTLLFGALAQIALSFPAPLGWYTTRRRLVLTLIYGLYPAGLLVILLTQSALANSLTAAWTWEQQAAVALKGMAYIAWGTQYRRATVIQRGQLHWILAATAAYDLPYLIGLLSNNESLMPIQAWLAILPPLGYLMAILPGHQFRFRLSATSGFVHGITNTLMAALFLSGLGVAANSLANSGQSHYLPLVTIGLAVFIALTTTPLISLLREQFDSWFNGTRGAQRVLLHQFTGRVSDQIALDQVTNAFREALEQGVQPSYAALWLWDQETQTLQSLDFSKEVPPIISLDPAQQTKLCDLPVFTPNGHLVFWPEGANYFGAIALISSGQLIGVCAIGPRIDGGAYTNDALRFLETLARSATLAFRNAQLVTQLEGKVDALRQAYHQLISVQESERQNLAAELHDETLQQLAHANLITAQLQLAAPGTAENNTFQSLQDTIVLTERRLREILRGIHPAVLTDLGLEVAIRSWLPRVKDVAIVFSAPDFAEKRLPDAILEMTLYRLTQEGVNNALKHAQASRIEINLKWANDVVSLEVIDNGIGFVPASRLRQGHFGLLNLRERVSAFGGSLQIDSQPGKGTRIHAQLPIRGGENHE